MNNAPKEESRLTGNETALESMDSSNNKQPSISEQIKNKILSAALIYAYRGWQVLPLHYPVANGLCSCGRKDCNTPAKHPIAALAPNGLKNATTDLSRIDQWFKDSIRNVGIATGAVSGIVVLDIDNRHNGDLSLAGIERQYWPLPLTVRFLTGGGGEHILFKHPGGHIPNSSGKIGQGIDVRGDGGYIVAPPSLHMSGRRYSVSVDHHLDDVPLADVPAWLLNLMRNPSQEQNNPFQSSWRTLLTGVPEGQRNDALARIAGAVLHSSLDPYDGLELLLAWNIARCKPQLSPDEVIRTVDSIAGRECARLAGQ